MKNGDMPSMPITSEPYPATAIPTNGFASCGLTKREMFAMAAMQGLLSCDENPCPKWTAEYAVKYADELLTELERTK